MSVELDKLLGDQEKETPSDAGGKKPEENKDIKTDPEVITKEQHLANVNKAIKEANDELKKKRDELKGAGGKPAEDDTLKINLEDPNSKAWDKHIKETVDPVAKEMQDEKDEIFTFTFKDFLLNKPALAANPAKMKEVIATYNRIKNNTGRTKEGVMNDLRRAYAAENYETLEDDKRTARVDKVRKDAVYADAGVSRGSSNYFQEREAEPTYDDQDQAILAKWGMSPQEHAALVKDQNSKKDQ